MTISRRQFCGQVMAGGGLLAAAPRSATRLASADGPQSPVPVTSSHIGNLYEFVQGQADRSKLELSFLHPTFKSLPDWQPRARARIFANLFYAPSRVPARPNLVRRTDKGDYVEEYLTFQTTPDVRVPAYVLVPKKGPRPAPGIVALHSHDGVYLWGKEKIVELESEHPWLTAYKQDAYGGKSIRSEEHTSELQSRFDLVCRLLLEKKKSSNMSETAEVPACNVPSRSPLPALAIAPETKLGTASSGLGTLEP